jgi:GNAT superfamily N-acetyltransferase
MRIAIRSFARQAGQLVKLATPKLTYRTIDPLRDAELTVQHQIDACVATFGTDAPFQGTDRYLRWLTSKVDEFPEGFLLAYLGDRCVGQLELEVPYGLSTGYVNLFYLTREFRGIGFGPLLHERAEFYFRSWEATSITLHVSPTNHAAMRFYRRMGYTRTFAASERRLWEMSKDLRCQIQRPQVFPGASENSG